MQEFVFVAIRAFRDGGFRRLVMRAPLRPAGFRVPTFWIWHCSYSSVVSVLHCTFQLRPALVDLLACAGTRRMVPVRSATGTQSFALLRAQQFQRDGKFNHLADVVRDVDFHGVGFQDLDFIRRVPLRVEVVIDVHHIELRREREPEFIETAIALEPPRRTNIGAQVYLTRRFVEPNIDFYIALEILSEAQFSGIRSELVFMGPFREPRDSYLQYIAVMCRRGHHLRNFKKRLR